MIHIPQENDVVERLIAWGMSHPLIRAMILTSSRTRPDGPVNMLSDYDLIRQHRSVKRSGRDQSVPACQHFPSKDRGPEISPV